MSKLSICHASLLESYLSVKLAICQSYLFVMLATCHSYMSKQLAHLVPVLRKFLVKLPLIITQNQPAHMNIEFPKVTRPLKTHETIGRRCMLSRMSCKNHLQFPKGTVPLGMTIVIGRLMTSRTISTDDS